MKTVGIVILAAGKGTRLSLPYAKPLAPLQQKRMIDFVINSMQEFLDQTNLKGSFGIVTGHDRLQVESYVKSRYPSAQFAFQKNQNGTADAVRAYVEQCDFATQVDYTLIACADTPCLLSEDLESLFKILLNEHKEAVAATFIDENPTGYGRIVRGKKGFRIVEEKAASYEEKQITEVNSGLYIVKTDYLLQRINNIKAQQSSGEFYLTDLFEEDAAVSAVTFTHKNAFLGVNTAEHLQKAELILKKRKITELTQRGVRFIDPRSTFIDLDVEVGKGATIYPGTYLLGKTTIGTGVVVEPGCFILNSTIEEGAEIKAMSHLEEVYVAKSAQVGPFARLRTGTKIGEKAKIGNFVETKKADIKAEAKVSHLSYVGDAEIGEKTNLGCGFITCNYDGQNKHFTKIGKRTFIGSDSQIVAPVEIGDDCFVACGSTITHSMTDGSFAISRGKQVTKQNMAHRFLKQTKNK